MFKTKDVLDFIWEVDGNEDQKQLFRNFKDSISDHLKAERYYLTVLPDFGISIVDDRQAKKPITPVKLRKFLETYYGKVNYSVIASQFDELQQLSCKKEQPIQTAPIQLTATLDSVMVDILKKYVCWTGLSSGDSIIYVRSTLEYKIWEITSSALVSLKASGLFSVLSKEIDSARRRGLTAWSVMTTDDGNMQLEDIYNKLYSDGTLDNIVQDEAFFKAKIEDFTNDVDVDALCYFPEDSDKRLGHCQHWLNFESQMAEIYRPVWRSLFAGIFDAKNRSRQIPILYDKGQTGKSNMIRAINNIAGRTFLAPVSKGSLDNQFWGSKIYGKRLVVFSDSGNARITQMDKIKQISGGDPIDIERKGKDSFSWVPNCRVIVTTNKTPELDIFQRHQTSRMVLIPLEQTTDPEVLKTFCMLDENGEVVYGENGEPLVIGSDYDKRMTEEFWDYLDLCRESYAELCPNRMETVIPSSATEDMLRNAASEDSDIFSYIMTYFLKPDPEGKVSNSDIRVILAYIGESSKQSMNMDVFRDFAKSEKYLPARFKVGGIVCRGFQGISLRPEVSIVNGDVRFSKSKDDEQDIKLDEENITVD